MKRLAIENMPNSKEVFKKILGCPSQKPIAVFDLDSTLYNVSHRTQRIIDNFAQEPQILDKYPLEARLLNEVRVQAKDWGMKEAFQRAHFSASTDFINEIKKYWKHNFFSSKLLGEDIPYPGAVEYVNALAENGVQIMYLTGRDAKNMRDGTIISLKKWSFPTNDLENSLIMKPIKGFSEDEDFKSTKLTEILQAREGSLWFFENEPVIINKVKTSSPHINIVWLDTAHSRKETVSENIFVIKKYSLL